MLHSKNDVENVEVQIDPEDSFEEQNESNEDDGHNQNGSDAIENDASSDGAASSDDIEDARDLSPTPSYSENTHKMTSREKRLHAKLCDERCKVKRLKEELSRVQGACRQKDNLIMQMTYTHMYSLVCAKRLLLKDQDDITPVTMFGDLMNIILAQSVGENNDWLRKATFVNAVNEFLGVYDPIIVSFFPCRCQIKEDGKAINPLIRNVYLLPCILLHVYYQVPSKVKLYKQINTMFKPWASFFRNLKLSYNGENAEDTCLKVLSRLGSFIYERGRHVDTALAEAVVIEHVQNFENWKLQSINIYQISRGCGTNKPTLARNKNQEGKFIPNSAAWTTGNFSTAVPPIISTKMLSTQPMRLKKVKFDLQTNTVDALRKGDGKVSHIKARKIYDIMIEAAKQNFAVSDPKDMVADSIRFGTRTLSDPQVKVVVHKDESTSIQHSGWVNVLPVRVSRDRFTRLFAILLNWYFEAILDKYGKDVLLGVESDGSEIFFGRQKMQITWVHGKLPGHIKGDGSFVRTSFCLPMQKSGGKSVAHCLEMLKIALSAIKKDFLGIAVYIGDMGNENVGMFVEIRKVNNLVVYVICFGHRFDNVLKKIDSALFADTNKKTNLVSAVLNMPSVFSKLQTILDVVYFDLSNMRGCQLRAFHRLSKMRWRIKTEFEFQLGDFIFAFYPLDIFKHLSKEVRLSLHIPDISVSRVDEYIKRQRRDGKDAQDGERVTSMTEATQRQRREDAQDGEGVTSMTEATLRTYVASVCENGLFSTAFSETWKKCKDDDDDEGIKKTLRVHELMTNDVNYVIEVICKRHWGCLVNTLMHFTRDNNVSLACREVLNRHVFSKFHELYTTEYVKTNIVDRYKVIWDFLTRSNEDDRPFVLETAVHIMRIGVMATLQQLRSWLEDVFVPPFSFLQFKAPMTYFVPFTPIKYEKHWATNMGDKRCRENSDLTTASNPNDKLTSKSHDTTHQMDDINFLWDAQPKQFQRTVDKTKFIRDEEFSREQFCKHLQKVRKRISQVDQLLHDYPDRKLPKHLLPYNDSVTRYMADKNTLVGKEFEQYCTSNVPARSYVEANKFLDERYIDSPNMSELCESSHWTAQHEITKGPRTKFDLFDCRVRSVRNFDIASGKGFRNAFPGLYAKAGEQGYTKVIEDYKRLLNTTLDQKCNNLYMSKQNESISAIDEALNPCNNLYIPLQMSLKSSSEIQGMRLVRRILNSISWRERDLYMFIPHAIGTEEGIGDFVINSQVDEDCEDYHALWGECDDNNKSKLRPIQGANTMLFQIIPTSYTERSPFVYVKKVLLTSPLGNNGSVIERLECSNGEALHIDSFMESISVKWTDESHPEYMTIMSPSVEIIHIKRDTVMQRNMLVEERLNVLPITKADFGKTTDRRDRPSLQEVTIEELKLRILYEVGKFNMECINAGMIDAHINQISLSRFGLVVRALPTVKKHLVELLVSLQDQVNYITCKDVAGQRNKTKLPKAKKKPHAKTRVEKRAKQLTSPPSGKYPKHRTANVDYVADSLPSPPSGKSPKHQTANVDYVADSLPSPQSGKSPEHRTANAYHAAHSLTSPPSGKSPENRTAAHAASASISRSPTEFKRTRTFNVKQKTKKKKRQHDADIDEHILHEDAEREIEEEDKLKARMVKARAARRRVKTKKKDDDVIYAEEVSSDSEEVSSNSEQSRIESGSKSSTDSEEIVIRMNRADLGEDTDDEIHGFECEEICSDITAYDSEGADVTLQFSKAIHSIKKGNDIFKPGMIALMHFDEIGPAFHPVLITGLHRLEYACFIVSFQRIAVVEQPKKRRHIESDSDVVYAKMDVIYGTFIDEADDMNDTGQYAFTGRPRVDHDSNRVYNAMRLHGIPCNTYVIQS